MRCNRSAMLVCFVSFTEMGLSWTPPDVPCRPPRDCDAGRRLLLCATWMPSGWCQDSPLHPLLHNYPPSMASSLTRPSLAPRRLSHLLSHFALLTTHRPHSTCVFTFPAVASTPPTGIPPCSMASLGSKSALVTRLLQAKKESGKTYNEIAKETGLTNSYVAQLFRRQAHLKPETAKALKAAVPTLSDDLVAAMEEIPLRSYDPAIVQDPTIYRLQEAIVHYGESIKDIINEEFGDGIMSAIGYYCSVEKVKGKEGEDRCVIIMNGKYLPYVEQKTEGNVATLASTS